MYTAEEITNLFLAQGYSAALPWQAEPGEIDFEHAHRADTVQIVLEGEITFMVNGQEQKLAKGDVYKIPAQAVHSAVCGPAGCYYIFALK